MRASRTLRGQEQPGDVHPQAARGEIEALLESPELRRIFDGEPKGPGARFAPSAARRRREPARRAEQVETPLADLRPRRRRRTRIALGLVPLYLAGLILIFEVAREPEPLFQMLGTYGAAEEQAPAEQSVAAAMRVMAASADPQLESESAAAEDASAASTDGRTAIVTSAEAVPSVSPAAAAGGALSDADMSEAESPPFDPPFEKTAADLAKDSALLDRDAAVDEAAGPEPAIGALGGAAAGWNAPYPDPRAGPATAANLAETDPEAAAAAESALDLSPADRREVQLRLRLADFDPKLVDGIFGPDTRAAVAAWQEAADLPATGFLDEPSLAMLAAQTDEEYRAWQVAERARIQRAEAANAVTASSVPRERPVPTKAPADACRRTPQGEIAFGQSMACDARGVRENFKRDLHDLRRGLGQLLR